MANHKHYWNKYYNKSPSKEIENKVETSGNIRTGNYNNQN